MMSYLVLVPACRETSSLGSEPAYQPLVPKAIMAAGGLYQKLIIIV